MVRSGCGQSGDRILKLTVSEEWTDETNWFFTCWYMITKLKVTQKILGLPFVKNGCNQSGHGTPKLTVS